MSVWGQMLYCEDIPELHIANSPSIKPASQEGFAVYAHLCAAVATVLSLP